MKIYPLKDGNFYVNKNKDFYNLNDAEGLKGIKLAVQSFLIETNHQLILLDAGNGFKENGKPKILSNIEAVGINPEKINKILLSHLHKDHIDGLVNRTMEGWVLNFPNSEIYLQKREYDFAMTNAGNPSYDLAILQFIIKNAKIMWMEEDNGYISNEIRFQVSGGHSPFHQSFWIEENSEIVFYGADNLPTEYYLIHHLAYKTDFDGKKALENRQKWAQKAQEEHWKILLYHDMKKSILEF
jgi:glyoxylase-like metal-dependent hydrolase (beta-lactamase superfamily II)